MRTVYKIFDVGVLGLRSLMVHKVRSFLTALGILFGVWSVIAMLSISQGLSAEAQASLRELGSDNIIIDSEKPPANDKASDTARVASYGLTKQDAARLRENLPGVVRTAVAHRIRKTAYAEGRAQTVTVLATEPSYAQVARMDIVRGRFLTPADELRSRAHCVVTEALARRMLAYEDPIGQTLTFDGVPFVIVGVLSRLPEMLARGTSDPGNCVLIPLSSDRERFGEVNIAFEQGSIIMERVEVSQLVLQLADERSVLHGAAIAKSLLERFHDRLDYRITVPVELMAQRARQREIWNIMFVTIACVSLLVGGIGIMNIMLASVTERTREIGIRRALGAKRADITAQFLVESVTLTFAGGLLGIVVGALAIPAVVRAFLGFQTVISGLTLLLPFLVAVAVGLAAGLYPAYRAAKLDPITALRHE
jgi:putative ABC transport system permease protein